MKITRFVLAASALATLLMFQISVAEESAWTGHETSGACICGQGKLAHHAAAVYDESTGKDLRNFPRDRVVDYEHMKLDMRFEEISDMRFTAVETLTVRPIGAATKSLRLDAVNLDVRSVAVADTSVEMFNDDATVTLRFDPPLDPSVSHDIVFEYVCDHPASGMTFTPYSADAPHYTPEVHTQGQTITNRHWFIAHDSPNERMTTELIVNVPSGNVVSSNGRLVNHSTTPGRETWHWLQDKPHCSYLVSLVIGKFARVSLEHPRVEMTVWTPPGTEEMVEITYGNTGAMIDVFEEVFGTPYPWDRYDQLVLKNFGAGGMENTAATSLYPSAILDEIAVADRDLEALISHELVHQWTGDLITCKSWAHLWLNEGWATYGESLWWEAKEGKDGYLDDVRANFRVARRDKTTNDVAMVSPVWSHPGEVFGRAANPYPKGASVLHMLRMMLGDDVFFEGVRTYISRHAYGVVETADFRYALEDASGKGLEWFFDQWCYRPGSPELDVTISYDADTRTLHVTVLQEQHIDERTPAFRFDLPIHIITAAGSVEHRIAVSEQATDFRVVLDGVPQVVAVDPDLHVLKTITVHKPSSMWRAQVEHGPTIAARHAAIEALGEMRDPSDAGALALLVSADNERYTLRQTAVAALAAIDTPMADRTLRRLAGVSHPRVRVKVVEAMASFDDAAPRLAAIAGNDPSYAVRVAAINGLAALDATDHADLIVELTGFKSQHENVRKAALGALATLDDPRGLDLAIQYAAYGHLDRARPAAIGAIADLAHHDPERAYDVLSGLLDDPESGALSAAIRAIAKLGDDRAVDRLQIIAETSGNRRVKRAAERAVQSLSGDEG